MNRQILCTWLDLPEQNWPPDNYTLLGLEPGTDDAAQIEHRVHERLAKLRCYQLSHPEEATEGMNRLAQAYIGLTEQLARKTAAAPIVAEPGTMGPGREDTVVGQETELSWKAASPQVQTAPSPGTEVTPAPAEPDPLVELAHHSPEARRGLGTLAQVIERVDRTRQLLLAWKKAGSYLGQQRRKLTRAGEEKELERRLHRVYQQIQEYPGFIGQPGKPGYRVVAMARLEMTSLMFGNLDDAQRQCLAQDWQAGNALLLSHRKFLRLRFKIMRREGALRRGVRAVRAAINDHPASAAVLATLLLAGCISCYLYWFRP